MKNKNQRLAVQFFYIAALPGPVIDVLDHRSQYLTLGRQAQKSMVDY
ncbi:MAG: hypothetical protein Q7K57_55335 [Burkholderiaceae bacterium]|nr:hypothetical protein [Burkholderiaceae bacterium]